MISSTMQTATCMPISAPRSHPPVRRPDPAPSCLSTVWTSCFDACSAGTIPNTSAVSTREPEPEPQDRQIRIGVDAERRDRPRQRGQQQREQALERPPGEERAGHAAGQRDDQAFGEQLLEQAAAAGADRQPHGDLLRAARRPGEEQVGDVRAGDEQHQSEGGEDDRGHAEDVAASFGQRQRRRRPDRQCRRASRLLPIDAAGDDGQFRRDRVGTAPSWRRPVSDSQLACASSWKFSSGRSTARSVVGAKNATFVMSMPLKPGGATPATPTRPPVQGDRLAGDARGRRQTRASRDRDSGSRSAAPAERRSWRR